MSPYVVVVEIGKVCVAVFAAQKDLVGHRVIEAGAERPAPLRTAAVFAAARYVRVDVGQSEAACAVDQDAIERIADAASDRALPVRVGADLTTTYALVALDVSPVDIGFDAGDERTPSLPVEAGKCADRPAVDVKIPIFRFADIHLGVAKGIAGRRAGIEAGPAEGLRNGLYDRDRQIGGNRTAGNDCERSHRCEQLRHEC